MDGVNRRKIQKTKQEISESLGIDISNISNEKIFNNSIKNFIDLCAISKSKLQTIENCHIFEKYNIKFDKCTIINVQISDIGIKSLQFHSCIFLEKTIIENINIDNLEFNACEFNQI